MGGASRVGPLRKYVLACARSIASRRLRSAAVTASPDLTCPSCIHPSAPPVPPQVCHVSPRVLALPSNAKAQRVVTTSLGNSWEVPDG
jgi:hypothetical protein